jgi:hypothetical protein
LDDRKIKEMLHEQIKRLLETIHQPLRRSRMHIVVVTVTNSQIPQPIHGKNLARLARECFANQQTLTIDFKDVKSITQGFFQELILPLVAEFGSDFLKSKLKIVNMAGHIDNMMQSAFKNLEVYFDKLTAIDQLGCDEEIYAMNQAWLDQSQRNRTGESCADRINLGDYR